MMKRMLWLTIGVLLPVEAAASVGRYSSVAIGIDGLPLISYLDQDHQRLKVAHCSDVACTSATLSDLTGATGGTAIAIGGDGLGLIAYVSGGGMGVAHFANLACTSATVTGILGDGQSGVSGVALVVGTDGLGLLVTSFRPNPRFGGPVLYAQHCQNADYTSRSTTVLASDSS